MEIPNLEQTCTQNYNKSFAKGRLLSFDCLQLFVYKHVCTLSQTGGTDTASKSFLEKYFPHTKAIILMYIMIYFGCIDKALLTTKEKILLKFVDKCTIMNVYRQFVSSSQDLVFYFLFILYAHIWLQPFLWTLFALQDNLSQQLMDQYEYFIWWGTSE